MSNGALTIVHVTEASPSSREQTEHALETCGALARRGHHVVLVSRPDRDLARRCSESGVVHLPMPLRHRLDLPSAHRLASLVRAHPRTVLHAHGVVPPALAVAALRQTTHSRLVVEVDSCFPVSWRSRLVLRSRRVRRVVATSDAVRNVVAVTGRLAPERTVVVTPGVDCPAPGTEASDPAEARHGLGISPRALVVGQVGMSLWQGWRELLHSVPKLRDQFPNVLVLFAGSASRTQRRTALRVINEMGLRDHVRVMPPGLAAATVLRACDVVVDSSWAGRGFLWSPARAMALARPVVATATSGADELIQDGVSGILVPVREPLTLAAAVARLLRDPNLAAGMGLAGQLRVRELFSLSDYAQRLESLYDGALLDTA